MSDSPPASPQPDNNGRAIASLVFGILSLASCPIFGVLGLMTGYSARKQIRESGGAQKGDGMALAGIILSWVGTVLITAATIAFVGLVVLANTSEKTASLDAIGTPTGTASGPAKASADGNWKVAPGTDIFVGYRVEELFAGQTVKKTATGRTATVTGTMTVAGSTIPAVEIKADTTKLKSDETRRDAAIGTRGLETQKFPEATFKLTTPIALPSPPVQGQEVSVTATGDLTLHGVTKSIQVPLKAKWTGPTITVAGSTPIAFADYQMSPIEIAILKTDDNGVLELQLAFVPA